MKRLALLRDRSRERGTGEGERAQHDDPLRFQKLTGPKLDAPSMMASPR
jgi:hypothetical protein